MEIGTSSNSVIDSYDAFLSFRGPDTRQGFVDCLYHFMTNAGIRVFKDDEDLRKGHQIKDVLEAINDSKICVPVFSKDYPSSKWCMRELAKMVELNKEIVPIFFDVMPDDVKLRTELYNGKLREFSESLASETVQWKKALVEVASIIGWELKNRGYGEFSRAVVAELLSKLKVKEKIISDYLVGIDDKVESVMEMLQMSSPDVRFVGIHGMGGVGKTTLAKVVFNQLLSRFSSAVFLGSIRETWKREGVASLHKQLLGDLGSASADIWDCDSGIMKIKKVVHNQKVLIVLDDADHVQQIERLAGDPSWYGPGSRIIATTRNVGILKQFGELQLLEMTGLNHSQALKLFSRHAFTKQYPPPDFTDLSRKAVLATGGLPLALEVIGSLLRFKTIEEWEEVIQSVGTNQEIQKILMISYDSLEVRTKQIFLDIACFFINEDKTNCMYMWGASNLYPNKGLADLTSLSLVKMSDDNKLGMHDLVRDLGRDIVSQESLMDPGKRSRLWINEDSLEFLRRTQGKENVQALRLQSDYSLKFGPKALRDLSSIRFLEFPYLQLEQNFEQYTLPQLRWLSWHFFPSEKINLNVTNLAVLDLSHSRIDELFWSHIQMVNLKVLILKRCYFSSPIKTLALPTLKSLERLILQDFKGLHNFDDSFGKLKRLMYLDLRGCVDLEGLPDDLGGLECLETILMEGNGKPFSLPGSIRKLYSLSVLQLDKVHLEALPEAFGQLMRLRRLSLSGSLVEKLPQLLGSVTAVVELDLSRTKLKEVSDLFRDLEVSSVLKMDKPGEFPMFIRTLEMLETLDSQLINETGKLSSLKILNLSSARMSVLPTIICRLYLLQTLHLTDCHNLEELPKLPTSLTSLHVTSKSLRKVPDLSELIDLTDLILSNAANYVFYNNYWQPNKTSGDQRPVHQSLTSTILRRWSSSKKRPHTTTSPPCSLEWVRNLTKLVSLHLDLSFVTAPPSQLDSLSQLETLHLACSGWERFPQLPSSLISLTLGYLRSTNGWPVISNLRNLASLVLFSFSMNRDGLERLGVAELDFLTTVAMSNGNFCDLNLQHLPGNLRRLRFIECWRLKKLYNLSHLKNLGTLELSVCGELTEIEDLDEAALSKLSIIGRTSLKLKGLPIVGFRLNCRDHDRNRATNPQEQIYLSDLIKIRMENLRKSAVADG